MKRLIRESGFYKDINFNGKNTVLIYKNPTGREVDDIINNGANSIRAFIDTNGDSYCWDGEISHEDMKSKLKCSDAIRLNIIPKSNMDIYLTSAIKNGSVLLSYLSKTNLANYGITEDTDIYINTDTYNAEWQDCYNGDTYGELIDDLENYEGEEETKIEPILKEITASLGGVIVNNYDGKILINDLVRIEFDNEGTYFSVHTPTEDKDYYESTLSGGIGGYEALSIISKWFNYHPIRDLSEKYNLNYEVCTEDNEPFDFSFTIDNIYFENNQDSTWKCANSTINSIANQKGFNINRITLEQIDIILDLI